MIVHLDADANYTIVTVSTGERIMIALTLKTFEKKLTDYKNFVRVNKSTILNTNYAQLKNKTFELPDKRIVMFSRRKWRAFQQKQKI
jgi:DNA-binding LytR/AlgR family response regulator